MIEAKASGRKIVEAPVDSPPPVNNLMEALRKSVAQMSGGHRTREKAQPLLAQGANWSDNPLAVCDRVVISL